MNQIYCDIDKKVQRCCSCKNIKPFSDFSKHPIRKQGIGTKCNDCARNSAREWYRKNRDTALASRRERWHSNREANAKMGQIWKSNNQEWMREYNKQYRLSHKDKRLESQRNRRARKMNQGGKISTQEWKELCDFYGNICLCCKRDDVNLTQDHVVPLILGGTHSIDNVQPLCASCNSSKHDKIIDYRI